MDDTGIGYQADPNADSFSNRPTPTLMRELDDIGTFGVEGLMPKEQKLIRYLPDLETLNDTRVAFGFTHARNGSAAKELFVARPNGQLTCCDWI